MQTEVALWLSGLGEWEGERAVTARRGGLSSWGAEHVLELVGTVAQL